MIVFIIIGQRLAQIWLFIAVQSNHRDPKLDEYLIIILTLVSGLEFMSQGPIIGQCPIYVYIYKINCYCAVA